MKIDSDHLKKLVKDKHTEDVVVTECKDGPTWGGSHLRMDVWVMRRSWVNMSCLGYEIKVSRSDFLQDQKWINYMSYCNEFSFVCPDKMIDPKEIPDDVGLYYSSKNGGRLFCKRKPVFRNVSIPQTIFMYILMSRAVIKDNEFAPKSKQEYFKEWLEKKEINYNFGQNVSKQIKIAFDEHVIKVKEENEVLKSKIESCSHAISLLEQAGIKLKDGWFMERKLTDLIKKINEVVPSDFIESLGYVQRNADRILKHLQQTTGEEQHETNT